MVVSPSAVITKRYAPAGQGASDASRRVKPLTHPIWVQSRAGGGSPAAEGESGDGVSAAHAATIPRTIKTKGDALALLILMFRATRSSPSSLHPEGDRQEPFARVVTQFAPE
ncbi:hypothetical protein BE20_19015 [Sorangium cellulosum]|nr:hypothetical protein BE20_19015 [Sorangium cellulosum]